jgi:hypothetical protein
MLADDEKLKILKEGVPVWNNWKKQYHRLSKQYHPLVY